MAEALLALPLALGVDEAGRGPVLGPMVYAAAVCPREEQTRLRAAGYDDSKAITEDKRASLFARMQEDERLRFHTISISAKELSASMLRAGEKVSLNTTSFDACFRLIDHFLALGANVTEVYVDTVGNPETYTAMLSKRFPNIKCVAEAKADAKYPVVSAASIAAKVTRDRELASFAFEERFAEAAAAAVPEGAPEAVRAAALASAMPSRAFGSGYPGDPLTRAWLDGPAKDPVFGYPTLARFSWQTVRKVLDAPPCVPVTFADDDAEEGACAAPNAIGALYGLPQTASVGATSGRGRAKFFVARRLAPAVW